MNRPHFRRTRRPRPTDPEPPRDWIDWLGNGLPTPTRYDAELPDVIAAEAPAIVTRSQRVSGYFWLPCPVCGEHFSGADPRPRGRYAFVPDPDYPPGSGRGLCICPRCIAAGRGVNTLDAEATARWLAGHVPSRAVLAAEVGGDLAAMAAPADWPPFSGWGEGYEIEPETRIVVYPRHARAEHAVAMGDAIAEVVTAMRQAETGLRADGRAYEAGRRSRTEAAAMRHARVALDDRTRGARDAAWILAGHVGAGVA